jgi:integrase
MPVTPLPFSDFRDRFLQLYAPPLRAHSTLTKARQVLAAFELLPDVVTTADLTTYAVARYVASRGNANVNTTISHLRVLKTASLFAHAEGWIERPPQWRRLLPRAARAIRKRHVDHGQVVALLTHLRSHAVDWKASRLYVLASVVAYSGLRAREAYHLQTGDVDLASGLLWVVARHRLKTEGSEAPVGLAPELVEILADWLPRSGPLWVFPGVRRIGPWDNGAPGYRPIDHLKRAGLAVGIDNLTWHTLRHTLAKLIVGRFGGSAEHAKTMLRHDDIRTTEEHYLHRDDAELLRAIAGRVSFRAGSTPPS